MILNWKTIRSVIAFLMFLEILFWVGGWIAQMSQFRTNIFKAKEQGVYRILCIGESTTLSGGNDSYPSQLQDILNKNGGPKHFQVINQGLPGAHTIKILNHLPQWLRLYHPDMVIAMAGALDPVDDSGRSNIFFLKKSKLYQLFKYVEEKITGGFKEQVLRQASRVSVEARKDHDSSDDDALFKDIIASQPESQKRVYLMLGLAIIQKQYEAADMLFQEALRENQDEVMRRSILKQYGEFLILTHKYGQFIAIMKEIPFDSWGSAWVKGYCHGQEHMDHVRDIIHDLVVDRHENPHVYGYAASCYEEGGRKDLADIFLQKIGHTSSYDAQATRRNYRAIKDLLLSQNIQPVFVQYPMRDIQPLLSIFENGLDRSRIIFVDNGPSFQKAVQESSYDVYFLDRALGDTGHATAKGNYLLASNIARKILERTPKP